MKFIIALAALLAVANAGYLGGVATTGLLGSPLLAGSYASPLAYSSGIVRPYGGVYGANLLGGVYSAGLLGGVPALSGYSSVVSHAAPIVKTIAAPIAAPIVHKTIAPLAVAHKTIAPIGGYYPGAVAAPLLGAGLGYASPYAYSTGLLGAGIYGNGLLNAGLYGKYL